MVNILIVDDQLTSQVYLKAILDKHSDKYHIIDSIENASLAYIYCVSGKIDLIIMDVFCADRENGIEAAKKIKEDFNDIKIIIITSLPEHSFIKKAQDANCESFWYKDSDVDLIEVIEKTLAGNCVYPSKTPILDIGNAKSIDFTNRELDILRELINGLSHQQISEKLFISKSTIKYHINNILSKTNYTNTVQLLIDIALQKFIITDF